MDIHFDREPHFELAWNFEFHLHAEEEAVAMHSQRLLGTCCQAAGSQQQDSSVSRCPQRHHQASHPVSVLRPWEAWLARSEQPLLDSFHAVQQLLGLDTYSAALTRLELATSVPSGQVAWMLEALRSASALHAEDSPGQASPQLVVEEEAAKHLHPQQVTCHSAPEFLSLDSSASESVQSHHQALHP